MMVSTLASKNHLAAAVLAASAALAFSACRDAVSPPSGDAAQPWFQVSSEEVRIAALGHIGLGDTTPGSDRQEFDLDVSSTLAGDVFYRDWSFVRADGSVGTLSVDADSTTGIRRFRDGSDACSDFTRGVEFDATGRQDTGELAGFTVILCDNGSGSGTDFFRLGVYGGDMDAFGYMREGVLTGGDAVKLGGGTPRAEAVRITGLGQIGEGLPLPGNDVQTFEFEVSADLTGAKFVTDWGFIRPDGTIGTLRVDPLDLGTGITAFRDGSFACEAFASGVEFDGVGRLNSGGDTSPSTNELRAFTVRACDSGWVGGGSADYYEIWIFHPDFTTRYRKGDLLTGGDIVKTRL